eukprot:SRR837773.6847.p2 GENE.SRR837773.6847~~SRR837773.6847.p2  ORF type:complete len:171 (+),score=23.47 SRR837773.6847:56-514(+)
MDSVNGPPPLVLTVYLLRPPPVDANGREDTRHIPSRMGVLGHVALWSSEQPPSAARLQRMHALVAKHKAAPARHGDGLANGKRGLVQLPLAAGVQRTTSQPSPSPSCFGGMKLPWLFSLTGCCVFCSKGDSPSRLSSRFAPRHTPQRTARGR